MLSIARQLAPFDIPLIGVNQGRLGFLTDIALSDMEPALSAMLDGEYVEETRTLLDTKLMRGNGQCERSLALNDVVVNRGALGGMIDCAVTIDEHFVYAMRADGLIVATPTGSTAYSLSAGGPIVVPSVDAIVVAAICPHTLAVRPLVVPSNAAVTVEPIPPSTEDVLVSFDGQVGTTMGAGERLVVKRAAQPVLLVRLGPEGFFARMRKKLQWGDLSDRERK